MWLLHLLCIHIFKEITKSSEELWIMGLNLEF